MSAPLESTLAERVAVAGYDWLCPDWPPQIGVGAVSTARGGGTSAAPYASLNLAAHVGDDAAAVANNRRRLEALLPAAPIWLDQVHGCDVVTVDAGNIAAHRRRAPVADGAVTALPGVVCAVLTADCLPVLFADRQGGAVGIAHAGWRGLAAGVLENTVAALAALGVPAARVVAWLGPAIGQAAFEVGPEVRAALCTGDPGAAAAFAAGRDERWHADLAQLARRRLAAAGIVDVGGGEHCTWSAPERFYSYRRERRTGRQASCVWRERGAMADRV